MIRHIPYPPALPAVDDAEKRELFAIYLNIPSLHHKPFEDCLADPGIRICLRNVAEATRKAREKACRAHQGDEPFELRP